MPLYEREFWDGVKETFAVEDNFSKHEVLFILDTILETMGKESWLA